MGITIVFFSILILIYTICFIFKKDFSKVYSIFVLLPILIMVILILSFFTNSFLINTFKEDVTITIVKKQEISDLRLNNETGYYKYNKKVSENGYILDKIKATNCYKKYKDKIKKLYIKTYKSKVKESYKFWFFDRVFVEKKEICIPKKFKKIYPKL